ncbi:hypothetical protein PG997_012510 [Apiospora hydei]|uniref:Ankyrin repeat protein n=1 Tax=Apiospora hydei TaxID=1337664 RepID=A0ABR1V706_9PEZI
MRGRLLTHHHGTGFVGWSADWTIFNDQGLLLGTERSMNYSNALAGYVARKHLSVGILGFQALVKLHADDFRQTWVREVAMIVLEELDDPVDYRHTSSATTILKAAVKYGNKRVIRSLMEKGRDIFRREGLSYVLEVACQFIRPEVLAVLLDLSHRHRLNGTATIADLNSVENVMAGPVFDMPLKTNKHLLVQGRDPDNTICHDGNKKSPWIVALVASYHFNIVALSQEYGTDAFAQI